MPEQVLSNQYFVDRLDTSHDWIETRTGIRERRCAALHETTSTMAVQAARRALERAGMKPDELDVIVCATATGDCQFPSTAAFIQGELCAPGVAAFDVGAACAGFLYATIVGSSLIASKMYRHALVIGAEALTRFADPEDRTTVVLFGDAAGAAILAPSLDPERGILYCDMGVDGTKTDLICVPAGGSRLPTSHATVTERLHYLKMKGREVYKFAVVKMMELIDHALEVTELTPQDLKLVIPHQSNLRIIESVREKMGLPAEKVAINIDRCGNTSAASVIIALDQALRAGTLRPGDLVLMVAIGAGLAWSTIILRL